MRDSHRPASRESADSKPQRKKSTESVTRTFLKISKKQEKVQLEHRPDGGVAGNDRGQERRISILLLQGQVVHERNERQHHDGRQVQEQSNLRGQGDDHRGTNVLQQSDSHLQGGGARHPGAEPDQPAEVFEGEGQNRDLKGAGANAFHPTKRLDA